MRPTSNRWARAAAVLLAALSAAQAARAAAEPAGQPAKRANQKRQLGPAKVLGELPAERVSLPAPQADFPAAAAASDGALWVAWLQWDGRDQDRIVVRRRDPAGRWQRPVVLDDGCFEHYIPALAARGPNVLAVWPGHNDAGFDLYAAEVTPEGDVSSPERLTAAPHADMNVRAAAEAGGDVVIVWQSFRNGQADVYARRLSGGRWGPEVRVSPSAANDWEPAVAWDARGRAWIVWDTYEHGNYDIVARWFDGRRLGPLTPITTEPTAEFHASVAVDGQGRAWVAWDQADVNWGKDFSRSSAAPGSRGLHYSRTLGLRVLDGGRLLAPQAPLSTILTGRMSRYAELPELAFDGGGALWLVFRHWTIARPHEMYHEYATRLDASGWTTPYRLSHSSGRNSQHAALARGRDGRLRVVYSSDGRAPDVLPQDPIHALPYVVWAATLPEARGAEPALQPVTLPAPPPAPPRRPRQTHTVGGVTYTLLLGDCHRHTDIRGHSGVDGSCLDTYRYALDPAQLDFLGLGDHNQVTGGQWPDGLRDYQWWFQQKLVDLFTHEPQFIGVYSYEHSLSRPSGHRNILHLKRGAPMRVAQRTGGGLENPDNQPPNLWTWVENNVLTQPGQRVVIVPHTFAAGPLADWNWPNPAFDCLLEIYQGCRGSYEAWNLPPGEKRGPTQTNDPGHFARDALEKDNVYGFVSFSDHGSTHNSWAGVWAEQPTRASLFDAMLAKRTFGASDEMILRVAAEDPGANPPRQYPVGAHIAASAARPLRIHMDIAAPDTILRVDVVKNGRYVYTTRPHGRTFQGSFTDVSAEPGECYYYVRVFQRDPEAPDGDPEIGWASPFFVTYR